MVQKSIQIILAAGLIFAAAFWLISGLPWPPLLITMTVILAAVTLAIFLQSAVSRESLRLRAQELQNQLDKINQEIKILDRVRSEFIAIASHQLRTPPATIKWYAASILSGDFGALDPGLNSALQRIQMANDSQIATIDDLLNVSQLERNRLEYLFEPANLEQIIRQQVVQLQPLAMIKNLALVYRPPQEKLPAVIIDREKIRQVINNLIDNAIKYTPHGTIVVDIFRRRQSLEVRVADSGKGIGTSEADYLFEKFTRGHDSLSHSSGLGLGLYVAKTVIDEHKGKIWAESKGLGQGATFAFSLPVPAASAAYSPPDLTVGAKAF